MTYHTHFVSSIALALPIEVAAKHFLGGFSPQMEFLFFAGVGLGSLFPDIDEPRSFVGKTFRPLSLVFSLFTQHRGFTHNIKGIVFLLLFLGMTHFAIHNPHADFFIAGFFLGYIFHIVGDAMTWSGIRNFCCKKTLVLLPYFLRFKTGSPKENLYFLLFTFTLVSEFYFFVYDGFITKQSLF